MFRLAKTASFRLPVMFAAIFGGCFTILILITYFTASSAMREQVRRFIEEDTRALLAEVATDGMHSIVSDINERLQDPEGPSDYYYFADSNGKKIAGNLEYMAPFEGWREAKFSARDLHDNKIAGDDEHELWGKGTILADGSFLFAGEDAYSVIVAQDAILESFVWSMAIALLLAIGAGIFASQRFLGRIDAINITSSAIMDGRLKERIPTKGTSDEMDRLSANLNKLFDSNQKLLESLKHVTTNIAHDLRSPLSRLREGLESARISGGSKKAYETAVDAGIEEADRLLATFSGLLRIAQIESGSRKAGFRSLDLSDIVERVASAYKAVAEDQCKRLHIAIEPAVQIIGDRDLLVQMFANLVENAIRHTPHQTEIALKLTSDKAVITAEVAVWGPGIPADERDWVFERLYRHDASRSTPGSGLGLSLVAAVGALHDVDITLADNHPGLRVILKFPTGELSPAASMT
jgi:signal transduction histidine kinase